jgi:hypothetical protein
MIEREGFGIDPLGKRIGSISAVWTLVHTDYFFFENLTSGQTRCLIGEWIEQRQKRSERCSEEIETPIVC